MRIFSALNCPAESLFQNLVSANPIKFSTKLLNSLGAIATLAEFGGRYRSVRFRRWYGFK